MTETRELTVERFAGYPPEARALAVRQVALLRTLPSPLLAALLREVYDLDWRFPAERREVEGQLRALGAMQPEERAALVRPFATVRLPASLDAMDVVREPAAYMEQMTAALWSTGEMPAYRAAAEGYAARMRALTPAERPRASRLCVVVVGQDVERAPGPLFRKLRAHGVRLTGVRPEGGLEVLVQAVDARAAADVSARYAHWYVDGGRGHVPAAAAAVRGGADAGAAKADASRGRAGATAVHAASSAAGERAAGTGLLRLSYAGLEPARRVLLARAKQAMAAPKSGPEELRSLLARMSPTELGMGAAGSDPVMERFALALLTEGAGTQIFATTFVQWAGRECLRRAQPETLLLRFAPRQRQQAMDELLRGAPSTGPDAVGSLVDAEMGAWLTWVNLGRLPGAEDARFLVWWEGHGEAVAIGPGLPRGTESAAAMGMDGVLKLLG